MQSQSYGSAGSWSPPLFAGFLAGVGAFVGVFLLVQDFVSYGHAGFDVGVADWQVTSWYTLAAHHVPLSESISGSRAGMRETTNLISTSGGRFRFLYLLPPLVLFLAGVLVAVASGDRSSGVRAAGNGALLVVGYGAVSMLAALFAAKSQSGFGATARLGPSIFESFVFAAVLYPLVFGALGGLAYYVVTQL